MRDHEGPESPPSVTPSLPESFHRRRRVAVEGFLQFLAATKRTSRCVGEEKQVWEKPVATENFDDLNAHTPPEGDDRWHPLLQHLEAVATRAAAFGGKFGAAEVCRTLGYAHDLAKANPKFQAYLRACHEGRPAQKAYHSAEGAKAAWNALGNFGIAVLGHHGGMPDVGEVKSRLANADTDGAEAATALASALRCLPETRLALPDWASKPLTAEMLVRMCFSALVDADFLDTEEHFASDRAGVRGDYPPIAWYGEKLQGHMDQVSKEAAKHPSKVNSARQEILRYCQERASEGRGAFRLTVPTGGGKTLSGLTFALDHAALHGMDRVVVAIPYTSIIDQTAQVYGGIFGEENVLEHHSAYEPLVRDLARAFGQVASAATDDENMDPREVRRRLAAENWDCPLVVTTTVQLFESLFANKPARCRKLHNVARSVIVLDEVQTLPVHLLLPILDVLGQLVANYGCTVVFCTATQPDFSGLGDNVLTAASEIVEDPARYFRDLKRVKYEREPVPLSAEQVAERIMAEPQILCVLNSRPDAVRVVWSARACSRFALADSQSDDPKNLFHLSTLMCPDHRKKVLAEVRQRLKDGLPVRLVSTQVVEAGVDVDFPIVMRDLGPLDRIVQVAGRCNREGRLEFGRCVVFQLAEAKSPKGPYRTGMDLARAITEEHPENLDQPEVIASYFRRFFNYAGADGGKGKEIQDKRCRLWFQTVAQEFKLIEEDTVTVVAYAYDKERVQKLLDQSGCLSPRVLRRKLAPLTVSVPLYHFRAMQRQGLVYLHEAGPWLFTGAYNDTLGIGTGLEGDPNDLIT
jgi:CRISPR-associated endonuclease/helicase Cas3